MNTLKQGMIILSLFALLFAIVFVPMFYMEYQNSTMLKEFYISPVKTTRLDSPSPKNEDYNIWEHIGIKEHSVVVTATVPAESNTELREKMEEQLAVICRYKALPALSLTGVKQVSVMKETYMEKPSSGDYVDIHDSDHVLNVWGITVEYQHYVVCAYMDAETDAIYDVTIVTKDTDFLYSSEITDTGFLEYLKSFSEEPTDSGIAFSAGSYYSKGKICLYLQDSRQTVYRFNTSILPDGVAMESSDNPLIAVTNARDGR